MTDRPVAAITGCLLQLIDFQLPGSSTYRAVTRRLIHYNYEIRCDQMALVKPLYCRPSMDDDSTGRETGWAATTSRATCSKPAIGQGIFPQSISIKKRIGQPSGHEMVL